MNTLEVFLKKIVSKQLGVSVDQISKDSKFIDDLGGDSLDTVEMVLILEDKLRIEIPEEVAEELVDINSVIDYLKSEGITEFSNNL
jgi:acyl carrier protein